MFLFLWLYLFYEYIASIICMVLPELIAHPGLFNILLALWDRPPKPKGGGIARDAFTLLAGWKTIILMK